MTTHGTWFLAIDLLATFGGLAAAAVILSALIHHLSDPDGRRAPSPRQEEGPGACIPP